MWTSDDRRDPWASFQHDPRDPAVAPLRASDADRNVVHQVLAEAFADGRLDRDEYDERSGSMLAARTLGELPPLVSDLVPDRPLLPARVPLAAASSAELQRRAEDHWRDERRNAFFGFVGSALVTWAIWTGDRLGRLVLPLAAHRQRLALMNFLRTAANRREIVASELERLERKRAKEIEKKRQPGPDAGSEPHVDGAEGPPVRRAADRAAAGRARLPVPRRLDRRPGRPRRGADGAGLHRRRRRPSHPGAELGGPGVRRAGHGLRGARGGRARHRLDRAVLGGRARRRSTSSSPTR